MLSERVKSAASSDRALDEHVNILADDNIWAAELPEVNLDAKDLARGEETFQRLNSQTRSSSRQRTGAAHSVVQTV